MPKMEDSISTTLATAISFMNDRDKVCKPSSTMAREMKGKMD